MEFKCKICAGSLTIDQKTRIATCDYCGTKQVLPMFGDDSSRILYERGNQYLLHNEYDKAEAIFNQLLSVNTNDAEIYWDLVLCRYGVTYAKDPQSQEYIPTCNRTQTESVFKNENYKKAIELSPAEKATLYKKDAEIIEKIQKGILELARKEKPFDIFISYKETDENGYRTKDSIEAQKLYDKLTELGYKVFFSRITLESKVGEEYEPIIYAALSSSKVMITICSSADYIRSAWVENEWSRFLVLRRGDMSKNLIPVYFDMDESELPEEFELLSAQNLKAEDFEQELIRGIKKLIPTPITRKENQKKITKIALIAAAIFIIVAIPAAYLITKPARDEKKRQEEYAIEMAQKNDQYSLAMQQFDEGNYDAAKAIFDELSGFENADGMAVKCIYYADYLAAMELYYERKYPEATWAFAAIGDYEEVNEMVEKCKRAWRENNASIAFELDPDMSIEPGPVSSYYITLNGAVEAFGSSAGTANIEVSYNDSGDIVDTKMLTANEHGKIVSIAQSNQLYAIYEDGYVCNSAYNNGIEENWKDVIQISDRYNYTNAALMSDGTIRVGDTSSNSVYEWTEWTGETGGHLGSERIREEHTMDINDKWLEDVYEWPEIVQLESAIERDRCYGEKVTGVLVGVDKDGRTHSVITYNESDEYARQGVERGKEYIDGLESIEKISVNIGYTPQYESINDIHFSVWVAALDKKGVMHLFTPYGIYEKELGAIKDFWISSEGLLYFIDSYNRLRKLDDDKILVEGALYVKDGFCITESGTIYKTDGTSTDSKTRIYDVWLER